MFAPAVLTWQSACEGLGVFEEVDRLLDGVRRLMGVEKGEGACGGARVAGTQWPE